MSTSNNWRLCRLRSPTALGAKVARPGRPVVALCGDGGFMYNMQELATAVHERINVVAVVFNDDAYGNASPPWSDGSTAPLLARWSCSYLTW